LHVLSIFDDIVPWVSLHTLIWLHRLLTHTGRTHWAWWCSCLPNIHTLERISWDLHCCIQLLECSALWNLSMLTDSHLLGEEKNHEIKLRKKSSRV